LLSASAPIKALRRASEKAISGYFGTILWLGSENERRWSGRFHRPRVIKASFFKPYDFPTVIRNRRSKTGETPVARGRAEGRMKRWIAPRITVPCELCRLHYTPRVE
jgi:hypothetical protein